MTNYKSFRQKARESAPAKPVQVGDHPAYTSPGYDGIYRQALDAFLAQRRSRTPSLINFDNISMAQNYAGAIYLPISFAATQLSRVAEYIRNTGLFTEPEASETMVRGWHVEGLAVRPDHRMVAHTGFLLWARRLAPGAVPPEIKRRASKTGYGDQDVELWTPGAVGDRLITDKNLRKRVREAQRAAEGARQAAQRSGDPDAG